MSLSRVLFWALVVYVIGGFLFECGRKPVRCTLGLDSAEVEACPSNRGRH